MAQAVLFSVNEGKRERVSEKGEAYSCYAIKTKLVTNEDKLEDIVDTYIKPVVRGRDIVFVSEKMVACLQGRAIPLNEISPTFWARFLCRFVVKNPAGIGLGMPETMQCAIEECSLARILLASVFGAVGKIFKRKGWFYHIAGYKAAAIDGPCEWTIPPYNTCVVLSPNKPNEVAAQISARLENNLVLVVDVNDLGGRVLGMSHGNKNDAEKYVSLLSQNPLGQTNECTPVGILRRQEE